MAPLNVNFQSENEEIISIYQRPAELSLEVPEDFDVFSMDDHELQVSYYSLVIVMVAVSTPEQTRLLIIDICVSVFVCICFFLIRSCQNLEHRHGGQERLIATVRSWMMMKMYKSLRKLSGVHNTLILRVRCVILIYSHCIWERKAHQCIMAYTKYGPFPFLSFPVPSCFTI